MIGLGSRRTIALRLSGSGALDRYRAGQIANALDVSIDWLLGRTKVMDVLEIPEPEPLRTAMPTSSAVRRRAKKT